MNTPNNEFKTLICKAENTLKLEETNVPEWMKSITEEQYKALSEEEKKNYAKFNLNPVKIVSS